MAKLNKWEKYLIWSFLNVWLPAALAALSYFIAMFSKHTLSTDDLLVLCYASGELLIIALILFAVIISDIAEYRAENGGGVRSLLAILVPSALLIASAVAYGVFKYREYAEGLLKTDVKHYIATFCVTGVGFACFYSLVCKAILVHSSREVSS